MVNRKSKLIIGISSRALFDLDKSHEIYKKHGLKSYEEYQIDNEDKTKPFTDEELAEILGSNEYHIARRTVAKYRETMNIAVARIRREL